MVGGERGQAVVDIVASHQAEGAVAMLGVAPGEEALAERLGVLVGAEPVREVGPVLERLKCASEKGLSLETVRRCVDRVKAVVNGRSILSDSPSAPVLASAPPTESNRAATEAARPTAGICVPPAASGEIFSVFGKTAGHWREPAGARSAGRRTATSWRSAKRADAALARGEGLGQLTYGSLRWRHPRAASEGLKTAANGRQCLRAESRTTPRPIIGGSGLSFAKISSHSIDDGAVLPTGQGAFGGPLITGRR